MNKYKQKRSLRIGLLRLQSSRVSVASHEYSLIQLNCIVNCIHYLSYAFSYLFILLFHSSNSLLNSTPNLTPFLKLSTNSSSVNLNHMLIGFFAMTSVLALLFGRLYQNGCPEITLIPQKSVIVKAIHSSEPNKLLTSEYKSWLYSYINNLRYFSRKEIVVEMQHISTKYF